MRRGIREVRIMLKMTHMTIAILGGGAAGLMAAAAILETSDTANVILFERNRVLGAKVRISGGGRCNVTTGIRDVRELLKKYPRGGKFLTSAMYAFPPEAVEAWFETHDVPLKTEEDGRVFPVSNNGDDVVVAFERLFATEPRIRLELGVSVSNVSRGDSGTFQIETKTGSVIEADRLILTTGGQAYRHTGSVGDGYAFAQALGHTITPLAPSLNAFFTKETWPKNISGCSFEAAEITAHVAKPISFTGPFLFTHKGVSGPGVFALSSMVAFEPYDAEHPLKITIDLFPDETSELLRTRIEGLLREHVKKTVPNALHGIVSRSFLETALMENAIPLDLQAAHITKKSAEDLIHWFKAIPLTVIARGAGDEFVTAGGVETTEIDPKTMGSLVCPGLFFAGELMNVDGFTGGFNLQASWAAGRLAGEHAGVEKTK